jgi:hydrogenase-4 membrane subunit HyfE
MDVSWLSDMGKWLIPVLELAILFTSLYIVTTTTIGHVIAAYRWQNLLLLIVATTTVAKNWRNFPQPYPHLLSWQTLFLFALMAWPVFLFFIIGRALALATISETRWLLDEKDRMDIHRTWVNASFRQKKPSLSRMGLSMVIYLVLVIFAFVVAFRFIPQPEEPSSRIGLGVALGLQFAGLFTLMTKRDLISQVIGIFVMDHGMYLSIMLLIPMPTPAGDFLLALYLYTFITLLLLFFLLPNLRRIKQRIDLDALQAESPLKG